VLNSHAALAAKKSLALTHSPCPTVKLRTDRLRLERILNNLITNAIKFTDAGSVRIDVECSHDGVEISVVDTGIGIKADHQKRLFEEFFQVQNHERDRQKGFGLGLAICNRLVRQLGGDLRVESEPGKGSKFTVVLPEMAGSVRAQTVSAAPAIQTASINRPAAGAAGGG
jgi:signal transduction histidine kinase